jgi:hypothetical protein
MLGPDGFVPIACSVDGINRLEYVIKDSEGLGFRDACIAHIIFEVDFIGLSNEGEYAIVGNGHDNPVNVLREGDSVHIGEYLLIVLERLIKAVFLEFGNGKYFGIEDVSILVVFNVEDGVELIMKFGNLAKEPQVVHAKTAKILKSILYIYSYYIYLGPFIYSLILEF